MSRRQRARIPRRKGQQPEDRAGGRHCTGRVRVRSSDHPLRQHGIRHLDKAGDIGAFHVVDIPTRLLPVVDAVLVDVLHDRVQLLVDLGVVPRQAHRVLRHFQPGGRHAAGVAGLARRVEDLRVDEAVDGFQRRWHVGAFGHADHAVAEQRLGIIAVQLVLRCARQRDVGRHMPRGAAGFEGHAGAGGKVDQAAALFVLEGHDFSQLLGGHALRVVQHAAGVRQRQHLGAQLDRLLGSVLRHVARAGDQHAQAVERAAATVQHFLREVDGAVAGGFRSHQAAAIGQALAGKDAGGLVRQLLHHAGHEAHFTRAHADVAGRDIGVRAQVTVQLGHQRLAEAHHFGVGLALGIEVGAALAAAHGQRGQRVLEGLLEAQELQHRQIHGRVKAHAALVRADGRAVLDAEGAVDLHLVAVVGPGHAELDHALGLDQALEQGLLGVARIALDERPERHHHFLHGLEEFRLIGVAAGDPRQECVEGRSVHDVSAVLVLCLDLTALPAVPVSGAAWRCAEGKVGGLRLPRHPRHAAPVWQPETVAPAWGMWQSKHL
ncbi:conserved hypothetical protein [Cupriavidus oxalaticus]|uniref:Uncharacterized protein n=1 Tax=Cupriavidus oxalaticus TaxID=96344 RepID=A0A976BJT6_9BURK|nr:conserved hypothetical protein [Cupriavidus oxalaticus]